MSVSFELQAESRTDQGKGASRRLRRAGKLPAILYGAGKEPQSISLDHNTILLNLAHEAFYSHILTLTLNGKTERVILRDLQRHPFKPVILHLDLQRVSEGEKIRMHVPLHFINEQNCVGVKLGGGMITHQLTDVEVECLPEHLPEFIEVDVANMQAGESLHLSQLQMPQGVTLVALASHDAGSDHDLPVMNVIKSRTSGGDDDAEESSASA
ncbi:50S ribosomal protein L25/general stress protein Ctc [Thiorhodospira sibirica]|uniref:50S ribosomal protein L25/general stress protein Ctc n=1 Tax=Thiorhodospira sibirica TaxID=154347 RepID=UPI00022C5287|nr:50S ribosomal protein L25/general stress protein Ctc [Thiorhodospira sibirica]